MGGDGVFDPTYETLAGTDQGRGRLRHLGRRADRDAGLGQAVHRRLRGGQNYPDKYAAYGAYTYDATTAIINAVKAAYKGDGKAPTRDAVLAAMASVSFTGATGQVSFDQYGDTTNKVLTMYGIKGGAWRR